MGGGKYMSEQKTVDLGPIDARRVRAMFAAMGEHARQINSMRLEGEEYARHIAALEIRVRDLERAGDGRKGGGA